MRSKVSFCVKCPRKIIDIKKPSKSPDIPQSSDSFIKLTYEKYFIYPYAGKTQRIYISNSKIVDIPSFDILYLPLSSLCPYMSTMLIFREKVLQLRT